MINVLIVDDSATMRQLIRSVLTTDPELHVAGEATNGEEALKLVQRLDPDVVTMDIEMPRMDGYSAIRRIMSEYPRPIIVLTSTESDIRLGTTYKGVEAGALMVVGKPRGLPDKDKGAHELIQVVKAMSDVKVVRRRWPKERREEHAVSTHRKTKASGGPFKIVAIGTSTGGPPALRAILEEISNPFPVPVVVVQHISKGFTEGLARWLNETIPLRVKIGVDREPLVAGTVYLAPDDVHMQVTWDGRIDLQRADPVDGHRPSVTALFRSVAAHYGTSAVGVLLTGMGKDGAQGLYEMKQAGGYTVAQDKETSIVFGMPGEAVAMGAASDVLPLQTIGRKIKALVM